MNKTKIFITAALAALMLCGCGSNTDNNTSSPSATDKADGDIGNSVNDIENGVGDTVKDIGNSVGDTAKDIGGGAGNAIKDAGDAVGNAAKDMTKNGNVKN